MAYDCYKTPDDDTWFDFREAWNDYRGADGYSILGCGDFQSYVTSEAEDFLLNELGLGSIDRAYHREADELAWHLEEKHGEEYVVREMHGCCQSEWALIVTPKRFVGEIQLIEQEFFNECEEWHCVPESGCMHDGVYCWTYPLISESNEEQLRNICGDDVVLHYPRTVLVWD